MIFSFAQLKNIKFTKEIRIIRPVRLGRDDIMVLGIIILFLFLGAVLFADGYLFYQTVFKKEGASSVIKNSSVLTTADVEDAVKLFDERQKKFDEILAR